MSRSAARAQPARISHSEIAVSYWIRSLLTSAGVLISINHIFSVAAFGYRPSANEYYYLVIAFFLPLVFLNERQHMQRGVPGKVINALLAIASFCTAIYLAMNANQIVRLGWDLQAPPLPTMAAGVLCCVALEALRRCAGYLLFAICLIGGVFPMFADGMPGFLWGSEYSFAETIRAHALGSEGIIGVPLRVLADTLIGYLIFGVVLVATGGGAFFMKFAEALMGGRRGGPAKVSVIASGLFGSLSGSVVSNIVSTGAVTIPAMKKAGYSRTYAGAVEACASTGGSLMPPVMGAVAFIMAAFLNVSYVEVMIAATIPSFLFFLTLYLQVDSYAAKNGLKGLEDHEREAVGKVLKEGWVHLLGLATLMYFILAMRLEAQAPYYASLVLLIGHMIQVRPNLGALVRSLIDHAADNIVSILGILVGVGLIIGGLSITGVGTAFSRELIQYSGGNIYLLLLLGAVTSFILGMGMTATACYIFLAVVLGPALIDGGLNPLASHLFILYYGMLSFITPPVALGAVAAAGISGAGIMATAFSTFRIGIVLYILPFIFVLHPPLILQGDWIEVSLSVVTALVAVWALVGAAEGYLLGAGRVSKIERVVLAVMCLLFFIPGTFANSAGVGALLLFAVVRSTLVGLHSKSKQDSNWLNRRNQ
ncbi:TRAP transporter fused permease subunit [Rhodobacteraceae bacterium D3-12]|nr:TRAP transporter fused permease subunit [Rhodobacteraceae bacterium D3-12]